MFFTCVLAKGFGDRAKVRNCRNYNLLQRVGVLEARCFGIPVRCILQGCNSCCNRELLPYFAVSLCLEVRGSRCPGDEAFFDDLPMFSCVAERGVNSLMLVTEIAAFLYLLVSCALRSIGYVAVSFSSGRMPSLGFVSCVSAGLTLSLKDAWRFFLESSICGGLGGSSTGLCFMR